MYGVLEEFFENAHARKLVAVEFLRLGLKVNSRGNVFSGQIQLSPVKIARALGVDRRVVIDTAKDIAGNEKLFQIFFRLESRAFLGNAAKELGLDSIEIRANPKEKGVVAVVAKILADQGMTIRQIIADDPDLFPDPVLSIVLDEKLDAQTIKKIKDLPFAQSVTIK